MASPSSDPVPIADGVFRAIRYSRWLNVKENICFGLREKRMPQAQQDEIAAHYVAKVGLSSFQHHYPKMLSGGMQQRTAIARALANDPKIILLDEPFGALDNQTRGPDAGASFRSGKSERKTVLFVTHDIEEAIFMANRVVVMTARPGRVKADVSVTGFRASATLHGQDVRRIFGMKRRLPRDSQ